MFGAFGKALAPSGLTFVSETAMDADIQRQPGLEHMQTERRATQSEHGPQTDEVCAEVLPLAQRYLLL